MEGKIENLLQREMESEGEILFMNSVLSLKIILVMTSQWGMYMYICMEQIYINAYSHALHVGVSIKNKLRMSAIWLHHLMNA